MTIDSIVKKGRAALRLGRAVGLVWRLSPGLASLNALLILLQGAMPLLLLYFTKLLVDAAALAVSAPDKAAAFSAVWHAILYLGLAALAEAGLKAGSSLVNQVQGQEVSDKVSDLIHQKSVAVDLAYYETPSFYDALHRDQVEAPYRPARIVAGLFRLGQNAITLAGMAGVLFFFRWWIGAGLLAAVIPGLAIKLAYSRRQFSWQRQRSEQERQAWYYHWMMTDGGHAKEVRMLGLGDHFRDGFRRLRQELRRGVVSIWAARTWAELCGQAVSLAAVFASLLYFSLCAVRGAISLGSLVMYFQAVQRGAACLQDALAAIASLYEDNLFLGNLYEFLDMAPAAPVAASVPAVPLSGPPGIVFDHVGFSYPGAARPALEDVSFSVAPGQTAAIVGENGSGKSTVIKLLCRFYRPDQGRILLGGRDLAEWDEGQLRSQIGVFFQDFNRYQMTAGRNIGIGDLGRAEDAAAVMAAARNAGADGLIAEWPGGLQTRLGRWFEGGLEPSHGQWQRLALARAFLRDAPLLLLDEPSSSMDPSAEHRMLERLLALFAGRTAVIASHRFSTVRAAGLILVLDRGRLAQQGTHGELLASDGIYRRMFDLQARPYLSGGEKSG